MMDLWIIIAAVALLVCAIWLSERMLPRRRPAPGDGRCLWCEAAVGTPHARNCPCGRYL